MVSLQRTGETKKTKKLSCNKISVKRLICRRKCVEIVLIKGTNKKKNFLGVISDSIVLGYTDIYSFLSTSLNIYTFVISSFSATL